VQASTAAAVVSATLSRSAAVAPAPIEDNPKYDIEDQRRVIKSTGKGSRSQMSKFVPIAAFLILSAAILLVVFLVVIPADDTKNIDSTIGPTPSPYLPLEPTNNGNIEAAATTRFDQFTNSCDFEGLSQPNFIDQCACGDSVDIIASDVQSRWDDLMTNFMPTVYLNWNEPVSSCSAENQALLWLSSGINNGGEISNLLRLQRYALALLYIQQKGTDWRSSTNWMTEIDICDWEGVQCDGNSYVQFLTLDRNRLAGQVSNFHHHRETKVCTNSYLTLAYSSNSINVSFPMLPLF
jgi:hypothetical protein